MKNLYLNFKNIVIAYFKKYFSRGLAFGLMMCLVLGGGDVMAQYSGTGTFTKISALSDLTDGYYVVAYGSTFAMNNTNAGTYFENTAITPSSNVITDPATSIVWKIESNAGGRTIYNEDSGTYVSYTGSANAAQTSIAVTADNQRWTFAWSTTVFTATNLALTTRLLQYNTSSPRFACYTGSQQNLTLYKLTNASVNFFWNGIITSGTGASTGGSSTWNTSTTNWISPTNDNSGSSIAWTNSSNNVANFSNGNGTVTMPVSITANKTVISSAGYIFAPSATITLTSPLTLTQSLTAAPATSTVFSMTGIISSSGGLTQDGAGTTLLNSANTYTGATAINQGTLKLGASNTLASSTAVSLANTAGVIFDVNGKTQTVAALSGGGISGGNVLLGTGALTVSGNSSTTYSGIISNTGSFSKAGSSTLTLAGANTYTGATTVSAGTLVLGAADRISNNSNLIMNGGSFATGASIGYNQNLGTLGLSANSTIALGMGSHQLHFAATNTAFTAGRTLTITGWTGTSGSSGTAGKIFVGNTSSGLLAGNLNQIVFTGFTGTPVQLATGEIVPPAAPANDLCGAATTLVINDPAINGTLSNSTNTGSTGLSYANTKKDVWYSFTPTCTGRFTIDVNFASSTTDIDVDVFTGPCPATGSATFTSHLNSNFETITGSFSSGITYFIRVIAFNVAAESANFTISVSNQMTIATQPSGVSVVSGATANFASSIPANATDYQWQANTGSGWADVTIGTGGTTNSYTTAATTLAMNGYLYRVVISNGDCNTVTSNPATLTVTACIPTYTTGPGTGDRIVNVTLGALNNSSVGSTTPFYTFYNSVTIPDITQSGTANVSVTFGSDANQYGAIWIDFNQNGTFEASEGLASTLVGTNGTFVFNIPVPAGAIVGNTRMRIRGGDDNAVTTSQACGASNSAYGESEDYIVNVIASCTPPATPTTPTSNSPQCLPLGVTVTKVGTAPGGETWYWQTTATGTATAVINSAATYIVTTPGTSTIYLRSRNATLCWSDAASISITVNDITAITTQPADKTVYLGTTATFTVTANGAGLGYAWEVDKGSGFAAVTAIDGTGGTTASFTTVSTTMAMTGYKYRVIITGTCGNATSNGNATLTVSSTPLCSPPIWEENFNYGCVDNSNILSISGGNWQILNGCCHNDDFKYNASSLSYSGYPSSGIGGSAEFRGNSGSDDIKRLIKTDGSTISSGAVYASFLIKLNNNTGNSSGNHFFDFTNENGTFYGRVFAINQSSTGSGTQFNLGVSKFGGTPDAPTTALNFGTTYLVVVKYEFVAGSNNDKFSLWAFASGAPATEIAAGTATIAALTSGADFPSVLSNEMKYILLRQDYTNGLIDGIRTATTWEQLFCGEVAPSTPITYTWTGTASSAWNSSCNWSPAGVPGANDHVIFNSSTPTLNFNLNLTDTRTVTNFTLNGTGNIALAATGVLTINGAVTYAPTASATLNCASNLNIKSSASQIVPPLTYGNLDIRGGDRTFPSGEVIKICSGFAVEPDDANPKLYTYTYAGSTVEYISSLDWYMIPFSYHNLTFSGSGSFDLGSGSPAANKLVKVYGNYLQSAGTVKLGTVSGYTATLNIDGNATISGGILDMNTTIGAKGVINLKGDISVATAANLFATSQQTTPTPGVNSDLNFLGTYVSATPATIQDINISSNAGTKNRYINFNIITGSYTKLINQSLSLGERARVNVNSGATLDFGFDGINGIGTNALNIAGNGIATTGFTSEAGSYLKISSPQGIVTTSGTIGNIQTNTAPVINTLGTFHYIGKANQLTGNGIGATSTGRAVIVDLADNNFNLTPEVSFGITNATNTYINSGNGGIIDIRKGKFIETETAYITGSTGTLYMSPGTLYKIAKGSADATTAYGDLIPRMNGGSSPYILNGGTIELAGSSAGNFFQVLRSDNTNYDYHNITFSGSNILGTDYKALSSQTNVTDSLYITGTAIVDCRGDAGSAQSFVGTGGLIMDGGRIRFKNVSNTQPEILGTKVSYKLDAGVTEFYGSSAASRQTIKGKNIAGGYDIVYNQIEITGDIASTEESNVGQSSDNIHLNATAGKLTVKAASVGNHKAGKFTMSSASLRSANETNGNTCSVIIENGGEFISNSSKGFSGFTSTFADNSSVHAEINTVSLLAGSKVTYDRLLIQDISNQIPYYHLTISGDDNKTAPSSTLEIKGDLTKSSTSIFKHNGGTVLFTGAAGQSFNNSSGFDMTFNDVTINTTNIGLAISSGDMGIVRKLSLLPGAKLVLDAGNIILKSSDTLTANVGKIPNEANIISYTLSGGQFITERYVKYKGNWNLITAPVAGSTADQSVVSTWQGGLPLSYTSTGYGTQITMPLTIGPGLDAITPAHSLKWWDVTANSNSGGYVGVGNTIVEKVNRPEGFYIFVRGDRSIGPGGSGNPTILRSKGKLFIGNATSIIKPSGVSHVFGNPNTFFSVANPFASTVNFTELYSNSSTTNIKEYFQVWDPYEDGGFNVGVYRVLSKLNNYKPIPPSGLYDMTYGYDSIQSGQAFFVESNLTGTASVGFVEANKSDGSRTVTRGGGSEPLILINTNLHKNSGKIADGNCVVFNNDYSKAFAKEDARKISNSGENLGITVQNYTAIIEGRPEITESDTIFYKMSNLRTDNYRLSFEPENLTGAGLQAFLIDNFLNSSTQISLTDSSWYNFAATSNAASKASNRFMLVFKAAGGPLPVTLTQVTAKRNADKTITVYWKVEQEQQLSHYEVERSADGLVFTKMATVSATNAAEYTQLDAQPLLATNYYRIKAVSADGRVQYSSIVKVAPVQLFSSLAVYPNPVMKSKLQIQVTLANEGNYKIQLFNMGGQLAFEKAMLIKAGVQKLNIDLPKYLSKGNYRLSLNEAGGLNLSDNILLQ